jgi:hypothetical protein
MKFMIREFGKKLKGGAQGLVYFSGHGVQLRGRNYLIPVDADITSEADVEDQGVDANLVLGLMDEANNGLNVVILDACRNNPFARSFRSAGSGLAQVDAPTGTLIAYATAPGRVAQDGVGRNGTYTAELLKQMRVPGLAVEEMFKRVRANVRQQTKGEQVPWEASSLVGDYYFNRAATATSVANNPPSGATSEAANAAAFELEYWNAIKDSNDPEEYQGYLKRYPNGQFAEIARRRAAGTRGGNTSGAPPPATSSNAGVREKTFVVKRECTTPCSLYEDWDEVTRTGGRPVKVKFHGKKEWILLPNDHITLDQFSPGEAEFISTDSTPVRVQVGTYQ